MRVLIINVNSHTGSTGKIAYGLYQYLQSRGDEVKLCCRGYLEPTIKDENIIPLNTKFQGYFYTAISYLTGYEGIACVMATRKLIRILDSFNPDIVQLFNLTGHYVNFLKILNYLKRQEKKTVYSMMDDFVFSGRCSFVSECKKFLTECNHCPHLDVYPPSFCFDFSRFIFKRKKKIYDGFDLLTITGVEWSCNMARKAALTRNNRIVHIDHPINLTGIFYPRLTQQLRMKLGILVENKVVLTAIPANDERKGGRYFMELANRMIYRKDITFVFVGFNRKDWAIPQNMITVGYVSSQDELAEYYSLADLYVCTSLADTFPTTCLNALGCGVPLLGFDVGGVPYCAPPDFGTYVRPGDVDALVRECEKVTKKTPESINVVREFALRNYSEEVIYDKFYQVYTSGK